MLVLEEMMNYVLKELQAEMWMPPHRLKHVQVVPSNKILTYQRIKGKNEVVA